VPFFLRTGKRLPKRASVVLVHMKEVPRVLFNAGTRPPLEQNLLVVRIQPNEGFALDISSKVPGPHLDITPVSMDFDYCREFRTSSPEAYERLLLDVLAGDPTLFMRRDEVEASWRFVTPIQQRWAQEASDLGTYTAGTWGPPAADELILATGRRWRPV
jgi:glucose-6-phosphate 1-dehydrogenase